jgi:hypothetical protein
VESEAEAEAELEMAVNVADEYEPWFHGVVTRQGAEQLLRGSKVGTFLVRFSQSQRSYSISLSMGDDRPRHVRASAVTMLAPSEFPFYL